MKLKLTPLTILMGVSLAAILPADEPQRDVDVAKQINAANELLRNGHVEKAIQGYDAIVPTASYRDQLSYNAAVADYRAENLTAAIEKFTATSASVDSQLASRSYFNLGNCHYASALKLADDDRPAAIAHLRKAIEHYRSGVHIAPSLTDAQANIELAVQLIKQWTADEAQSPPQQPGEPTAEQTEPQQSADPRPQDGQQQQDDAQQQNPNEDPAEQQPSSDASEDASNQQPADQEASPSKSPSSSDTSAPDRDAKPADGAQSPTDAAQKNAGESQTENAHPEPGDRAHDGTNANQLQPTDGNSESASLSAEESELDDPSVGEQNADEAPPTPSGELTTAAKEAQEKEAPKEDANSEITVLDQNAMGQMNREEALKLLQAVRDRDMLRRLQQEQRNRSRRVPVERDW